jgi:hypothetical protein
MASTRVAFISSYGTVSIGATAAVIKATQGSRTSILIQNVHASQVLYLGDDADVTTSNGIKVPAGAAVSFDDYVGPIYGIASGAGTDVRYWQVGE